MRREYGRSVRTMRTSNFARVESLIDLQETNVLVNFRIEWASFQRMDYCWGSIYESIRFRLARIRNPISTEINNWLLYRDITDFRNKNNTLGNIPRLEIHSSSSW